MIMIPHDPGLRMEGALSEQQKKYLIKLGPHQPILKFYPNDGKNSFHPEWYKEFDFLEYSTTKDAVYCFVCFLFPSGPGREKSETAWIKEGVKNWRKMKSSGSNKTGKLQMHFNSMSHKSALRDYCNYLQKFGHVDTLLNKEKRNHLIEEERILKHNKKLIQILLDVTQTLAIQGIAFRGNVIFFK